VNRDVNDGKALPRLDYLPHFATLLACSGIVIYGIIGDKCVFQVHQFRKTAVIIIIEAVFVESIQLTLPYRTFNPWDMAGNLLGAVLTIVLVALTVKSAHALHHR